MATIGTVIALKSVRDKPELKSQLIEGLRKGKTREGQQLVIDVYRKVGVFKQAAQLVNNQILRVYVSPPSIHISNVLSVQLT